MSVETRLAGVGDLRAAFAQLAQGVDLAAQENVKQLASKLIKDAQANFSGSHPKGQPHVPNGENFPNIVTGTLRRSIQGGPIHRVGPGAYTTTVAPTARYGRRVELGLAPTGAYPYFGPAVKKLRGAATGIIAANIAKYLR